MLKSPQNSENLTSKIQMSQEQQINRGRYGLDSDDSDNESTQAAETFDASSGDTPSAGEREVHTEKKKKSHPMDFSLSAMWVL